MRPRSLADTQKILDDVDLEGLGRKLLLTEDGGEGYHLQVTYYEDDVVTHATELQKSRKWYVSPYMTVSEVVRTVYKALLTSYEHVVGEHFLYKGVRVFSPHPNVEALVLAGEAVRTDARTPPERGDLVDALDEDGIFDPRLDA